MTPANGMQESRIHDEVAWESERICGSNWRPPTSSSALFGCIPTPRRTTTHRSKGRCRDGSLRSAGSQPHHTTTSRTSLTNNLLFWQNRYGHASREHRILLEALQTPRQRQEMEGLLFGLYRGEADDSATFDRLADLGGKYTLIGYLFFLKDIDRYMPIQPTGFDRAFDMMGIEFTTLRRCSWDNYTTYLAVLSTLRPLIAEEAKLESVSLVDAHSFVWILASLIKREAAGELMASSGKSSDGRVLGSREKSIIAMRLSVENTVKGSNGQVVERKVKNNELRMTRDELEATIARLLDMQKNQCALTGIPLQFHGAGSDKDLLPSLDRIDSNGHYENENLQVVCQFINFWKGDSDNEMFARLRMLVRGQDANYEDSVPNPVQHA